MQKLVDQERQEVISVLKEALDKVVSGDSVNAIIAIMTALNLLSKCNQKEG